MKKLCVIGEALIDFIPNEKGLRLKDVVSFKRVAGGAPANVAAANAKLGGQSKVITKLGNDAFGHHLMDVFKSVNIDTSDIVMSDSHSTALAFVSLASDGNRDFLFYRKSCADLNLSVDEIKENALDDCGILHFCSVDLVESPMKKAHQKLIEMAIEKNITISFDPNVRINLWDTHENCRNAIHEFLSYADIIKISDEELEFISGKTNIDESLEFFFKGRCQYLIYTMGKDGAMIITRDRHKYVSNGYSVDVFDTTGAGDAFIGAFLYQLLSKELNLQDFLDFSNLYAAHTTTKEGAIGAMATMKEIEVFKQTL